MCPKPTLTVPSQGAYSGLAGWGQQMNYLATFIQIAPDSKAAEPVAPQPRGGKKSIACIEFDLISSNPYRFTQEEIQFLVFLERETISRPKVPSRHRLWDSFIAKPRACLRSSSLPKIYGWGLHFDEEGKVALVGVGSPEYDCLASANLKQKYALRSRRG